MRKENSAYSFSLLLLYWVLVYDLCLNQMLNYNFLGEQMHINPFYSRFSSFQNSLLCLIYSIVYYFLFLGKLAINRECNSLICTIAIPFSPHIMKNHLPWLYYFVILYVV